MGIERNKRKPKRQRTTAQRLRGRRTHEFSLPENPGVAAKPAPAKETAAATESEPVKVEKPKKAAAKKSAPKKTAAKKAAPKKTE